MQLLPLFSIMPPLYVLLGTLSSQLYPRPSQNSAIWMLAAKLHRILLLLPPTIPFRILWILLWVFLSVSFYSITVKSKISFSYNLYHGLMNLQMKQRLKMTSGNSWLTECMNSLGPVFWTKWPWWWGCHSLDNALKLWYHFNEQNSQKYFFLL